MEGLLENVCVGAGWRVVSPRSLASAAGYSGPGLAFVFPTPFGLSLVPILLAFGDGHLALDPSIAEIKPRRDERQAFLLRLSQ